MTIAHLMEVTVFLPQFHESLASGVGSTGLLALGSIIRSASIPLYQANPSLMHVGSTVPHASCKLTWRSKVAVSNSAESSTFLSSAATLNFTTIDCPPATSLLNGLRQAVNPPRIIIGLF